MAEASDEEGEHMIPATDGEDFSFMVWDGRVGLAFAYDAPSDTWLLGTPVSEDAEDVALAAFEVAAVFADGTAAPSGPLHLMLVRVAADILARSDVAPPWGEQVPARWDDAGELKPDPFAVHMLALQFVNGTWPAGGLRDGFVSAAAGGASEAEAAAAAAGARSRGAGRGRTTMASLSAQLAAAEATRSSERRAWELRLASLEAALTSRPPGLPGVTPPTAPLPALQGLPAAGSAGLHRPSPLLTGLAVAPPSGLQPYAALRAAAGSPPPGFQPAPAKFRGAQPVWRPPAAPRPAPPASSTWAPHCRQCGGPCVYPALHFPNLAPGPASAPSAGNAAQEFAAALVQLLPSAGDDGGFEGSSANRTRGTTALQEVWRLTRDRPDRVIDETLVELRRRLGLADHEPFTLSAYNLQVMRTIPTHRTLKKTLTMWAHLLGMGYSDDVGTTLERSRLLAHLLQSYKVTENAAPSNGEFADWELLPFPDPEGVSRPLALSGERAALAARRREEALLSHAATAAASSNARRAATEYEDRSAKGSAKRKPRPKGSGKGKGADAAPGRDA